LRMLAAGLEMQMADDTVWQARESLFDRAVKRDALVFKVTMLPSQIAETTAKMAAWNMEMQSVTQAPGIMTAAVYGNAETTPHMVNETITELRGELGEHGGAVQVLRMPEALSGLMDVWGDVGPSILVMKRVKHELDAGHILNRGCFAGGI